MRVRYAIVTMGEKGSWLGSQRDGSYFIPAFPDRTIRDSTGAGDVFAGSWLSTYLSTKDPVWASAVGSAFASLASRRTGLSKFQMSRSELFRRASWVYNHVKTMPLVQLDLAKYTSLEPSAPQYTHFPLPVSLKGTIRTVALVSW